MASVEITLHPGGHEILVEGTDISHVVREVCLSINRYELPEISFTLAVMEDVRINGDARLFMDSGVADLLREWGWTPPAPGKGVSDE